MRDYNFGNQIYMLRKQNNLTQSQLGKMLGVSNKAVSKGENGTAKPNINKIYRLSQIFDVSVDELVTGNP